MKLQSYVESRRVYLPLVDGASPPLLKFTNGVEVVELPEAERPNLSTWNEILSRADIRSFHETDNWLIYDYDSPQGDRASDPEDRVADVFVALNVAAPIGWKHFVMFTKTLESQYGDLTLSTRSRFHTRGWARLLGWEGLASNQVRQVVDGILEAIRVRETRFVNPVRLLENGLYSSEPYIQVLIWVMALDGLLMSSSASNFVPRICRLMGANTPVFPPLRAGGIVCRNYTVEQIAEDLYELRSVIAHGQKIPEKFWKPLPEIETSAYDLPYDGMPLLRDVLAEAALLLLCKALRIVILDGLMPQFSSKRAWRFYLTS